jgi:hypothetical protein
MAPGPSARRPLRSWGRRAPQSSAVSAARAPSLPRRRCTTRRGPSESAEFVAITAALRELTADFVLDGEAVAHCSEGLPDFHGLLGREGQRTACLYAFDLLRLANRLAARTLAAFGRGEMAAEDFRENPDVALVLKVAKLLAATGADLRRGIVLLACTAAEQGSASPYA